MICSSCGKNYERLFNSTEGTVLDLKRDLSNSQQMNQYYREEIKKLQDEIKRLQFTIDGYLTI